MYAVLRTGGKQYRVEPGVVLDIESLPGDVGDSVEFTDVLLVAGEKGVQVGNPQVTGASVAGKIVAQKRGPKLIIFKKRKRHGYRKKQGHRQELTRIEVTQISVA